MKNIYSHLQTHLYSIHVCPINLHFTEEDKIQRQNLQQKKEGIPLCVRSLWEASTIIWTRLFFFLFRHHLYQHFPHSFFLFVFRFLSLVYSTLLIEPNSFQPSDTSNRQREGKADDHGNKKSLCMSTHEHYNQN